jgi:V-type H+-transporting ATPase subunit a
LAHGSVVSAKIRKISESLGAKLFQLSEDPKRRTEQMQEVNSRIDDILVVLENTHATILAELRIVSGSIMYYDTVLKKEKAIYQTLNLLNFDSARHCLVAEGWVARDEMPAIHHVLCESRANTMPSIMTELRTNRQPPTYQKTNKFTSGFQSIIDAYGMASHQEINPAVMSIVTFPFLFAIMFGDLGHGPIIFLAACYLIWKERLLYYTDYGEIFDMVSTEGIYY